MEYYFVITCSALNTHNIDVLTKKSLLERLNSNYYGEMQSNINPWVSANSLDQSCVHGMFIIKGKAVSPRVKNHKIEYDIP